jgi:hypothetical protein
MLSNEQKLAKALEPKSDQLNSDDLRAFNKTILVTSVNVNENAKAQKITIGYQGDQGKPWKPSVGMGRVMQEVINKNPDLWIGETIELCRNPDVIYAGEKLGGIEIHGLSCLKNRITVTVTTAKGKRKAMVIVPIPALGNAPAQQRTQAPAAQPEQPNAKREWAVKLKAAVNYGSLAVDEVWAMVPVELRADMDSFYKEQFIKSQAFDPAESEPIPEHVSEQLPPHSLDDF